MGNMSVSTFPILSFKSSYPILFHPFFSSQPGEGFSEGGEEFCVGVVHHEVAVAFEAFHIHPADFNASFPVGDGDASPEGELMAWGQAHGTEEIVDLQDIDMDFILGIVCLFHDQTLGFGIEALGELRNSERGAVLELNLVHLVLHQASLFPMGVVPGEGDDSFGIVSQEGLGAGDHRDGTGGMGCHHNGHQHGQHHYFFHLQH